MPLASDRVSRGLRVQEVQAEIGEDNGAFAERLNRAASELGIDSTWDGVRLSRVRNGTQNLSLEDATVLARVDPQQRGWTWIAYGVPLKKNEDAWAVLARMAKKSTKSA